MKGEAPTQEMTLIVAHMRALEKLADDVKAHMSQWGGGLVTVVLPALNAILGTMTGITLAASKLLVGGALEGFATELNNMIARIHGLVQSAIVTLNQSSTKLTVGKGVVFDAAGANAFKDALTRANEQLSKTVELTKAELKTVGLTVAEQEKLKQETLLREAAKRAGLNTDTAVTAKMHEQAALAGQLKQQLVESQHAFQEMVSALKEMGSALSEAFKGAVLEGKKLNEVMDRLLKRLASKVIDNAFDSLFAPKAGGGGSVFMQLFKALPGMQAGGPVSSGAPYMVGERGPELFVPNRSGIIVPNHVTSGGTTGGAMKIDVMVNVTGANGDAAVRRIAAEATALGVRRGLSQYDAALPGRLRDMRVRGI